MEIIWWKKVVTRFISCLFKATNIYVNHFFFFIYYNKNENDDSNVSMIGKNCQNWINSRTIKRIFPFKKFFLYNNVDDWPIFSSCLRCRLQFYTFPETVTDVPVSLPFFLFFFHSLQPINSSASEPAYLKCTSTTRTKSFRSISTWRTWKGGKNWSITRSSTISFIRIWLCHVFHLILLVLEVMN